MGHGLTVPVYVTGMQEVSRAFAAAGKEAKRDLRKTFVEVARPIADDAEQLALGRISHIGGRWSKMRVGVTQKVVYVAPKQRGAQARANSALRRPNLAGLLMSRAMEPALERNEPHVERAVEHALDRIAERVNRHV